jgi:hypothetical protein
VSDSIAPEADPLIERARRAGQWIREHRQTFGSLVTIAVLGVGGALGWMYWQDKHQADASAVLAQGLADERGRVSEKDDEDEDDNAKRAATLYPTFKTNNERRDAALAKYREVQSKYPGTGAAFLARLSEAGLLLDQGDAKGALAAYTDVKGSALAQADVEVRGRAFEGMGFADELLAQTDAAGKDKHLDDALAAYKQLEQLDVKGLKELGMYHESRVLQAKGDNAKAVELLKDVNKRVSEPGQSQPFSYLSSVVEDRLRALDPGALPPKAPKMGGFPQGMENMSDSQIQDLIRQMQQQKGGAPK